MQYEYIKKIQLFISVVKKNFKLPKQLPPERP